jgi:hypothetical protein
LPRIRTIKPEAFISETLARVSVEAERTFVGLWTQADDEGRYLDSPAILAGLLWAVRNRSVDEVDGDLHALAAEGLIRRYEAAGRNYVVITNWHEHQKINRPTPSKIPAPPPEQMLF